MEATYTPKESENIRDMDYLVEKPLRDIYKIYIDKKESDFNYPWDLPYRIDTVLKEKIFELDWLIQQYKYIKELDSWRIPNHLQEDDLVRFITSTMRKLKVK